MKFGILDSYPNVRRISAKLADLAILIRPLTFFGAFVAGCALDFYYSTISIGSASFLHMLYIGFLMGFFQAGGQVYNQASAEEVEIDKINGKTYRPTVNGRMSLREAQLWSLLLFATTLFMSIALFTIYNYYMALLMIFFAVFYTARPLRVKRFFILNNLWQAIARGFFPAVFVALMYPTTMGIAIAFGLFFSAWVMGAQTTKDFGDVYGDKKFGIKTFPVVVGWRVSVGIMTFLFLYAFFLLNWLTMRLYLPPYFVWLNVLSIPSGLMLYFLWKGTKVGFAENNLAWVLFYATLASFYLLPAILVA